MKRRRPRRLSRKSLRNTPTPLELRLEQLENRLVLTAGIGENDCAPDLDFSALPTTADLLTVRAGETLSFNLFDEGAALSDTEEGSTTNGTAAGNLFLDPDETPANAELSRQGAFSFTPDGDQVGLQTFIVIAVDRQNPALGDTETFSVMVNPANLPPSFDAPSDPPAVDEDAGPQTIDAFITGISPGADEGDQTVTFQVTDNSNSGLFAAGPTITVDTNDPTQATLTYTPADDANGTAVITIVAMDDGGTGAGGMDTSAPQQFTITVNPINDEPSITLPSSPVDAIEDTDTPITGISISDTDLDETPGAVALVELEVQDGVVTLGTTAGLDITSGDGTADAFMSFTGAIADINAALAGLIFRGDQDFNGQAALQVTVNDQGNTGANGLIQTMDAIAINVAAVNDAIEVTLPGAPTVFNDETSTLPAISVADVDAGDLDIRVSLVIDTGTLAVDPALATVVTEGDGTPATPLVLTGELADINTALAQIAYTPDNTFEGTATLTVTANDQGSTGSGGPTEDVELLSITVEGDNNSFPSIEAIASQQTYVGETLRVTLTASDPDAADTLTFSLPDGNPEGVSIGTTTKNLDDTFSANLFWVPGPTQAGGHTITVQIIDDGLPAKPDSATFTVTVMQSFTVDTNEDTVDANPGDGLAEDASGNTSLRAAIQEANATPGAAKIIVPADNYVLTIQGDGEDAAATGDLDITDDLTIRGDGAKTTIIDAGGADGLDDRVFEVRNGAVVRLENLMVQGGRADSGGGILNTDGTLTIASSTVTGNQADADHGGGIASYGMLTIEDSKITNNTADNDGGGVFGSQTGLALTITDSIVSGNQAGSGGGGVYNRSVGVLEYDQNNYAIGGSLALGNLVISGSSISGNSSESSSGGGIYAEGNVTITNSSVSGNISGDNGGGVYHRGRSEPYTYDYTNASVGRVSITGSTISGNTATSISGYGGGIAFWQGSLSLVDSTVSGNSAYTGGGVSIGGYVGYESLILNSTISGNSAMVAGGGVYNASVGISVQHSTITNNTAADGNGAGWSNYFENSPVRFGHSIIAGNRNASASDEDFAIRFSTDDTPNPFTSEGFNLIGTGVDFGNPVQNPVDAFSQASDQTGVDPMLGPLQDNGGSTLTHAPLPGSPAIDAGDPAFDPTAFTPSLDNDQRGAARVEGTAIDIGSFETDLIVNNEADSPDINPGDGTVGSGGANQFLRAAIQEANAQPGPNTIVLPAGTFNLDQIGDDDTAALGDLDITDDLTIIGAGVGETVIDASGGASAINDRVFHILGGATVHIVGVTIQGGNGAGHGGGVFIEDGDLTLSDSRVTGNANTGVPAPEYSAFDGGGGIAVESGSTLTVNRSTIDNNNSFSTGAGIHNSGTLSVHASTISGNVSAQGGGGGVYSFGYATITLSTISGNTAEGTGQPGGGIRNAGGTFELVSSTVINNNAFFGGGLSNRMSPTAFTVANSIVAGNTDGFPAEPGDLHNEFTSGGHNLIGIAENTQGFTNGVNGDQVGDGIPINPELGPLADNGGPTQTHALLDGSPAIDAGLNHTGFAFDQRGLARVVDLEDATYPNAATGDGSDIGAYEAQTEPVLLVLAPVTGGAVPSESGSPPTADEITELTAAAETQLAEAGFGAEELAVLDGVNVQVVDLPASVLGLATGTTVYLDVDAAGVGWFFDDTPEDSAEFTVVDGAFAALEDGPAAGRVDLLSVLAHELGHVLGEDDLYDPEDADDWMYHELAVGARRLPSV